MSDFERVVELATALPETELSTSWGTPAVKAKGTMILREYEDPGLIVLKVDLAERAGLTSERPETFIVTPHFENYPYMLVRTADVDTDELRELIVEAWRMTVPKRVAKAYDQAQAADGG